MSETKVPDGFKGRAEADQGDPPGIRSGDGAEQWPTRIRGNAKEGLMRFLLSIAAVLVAFLALAAPSVHAGGACCLQDATCLISSLTDCTQQVGLYLGEGMPCDPDPCPPAPINDTCAHAIPLVRGRTGLTSGTTTGASPDYDPGAPGCTGGHAWGPDVAYQLDLLTGDIADLRFTAWNADGAMYLVTDCSRIAETCVAGADITLYAEPEHIIYEAPADGTYYLILDGAYQYLAGEYTMHFSITCLEPSATDEAGGSIDAAFQLATPNPFHDVTRLSYELPRSGRLRIDVVDASGRFLRQLFAGDATAGIGSVSWDGRDERGRDVVPGVYFCRLQAEAGNRSWVLVKLP